MSLATRLASASLALALLNSASSARAGSFDPQVGQAGSKGIAASSPLFQGWASSVVDFKRGPMNAANPSGGNASFGDPTTPLGSLGDTTFGVVSLGDGGSITLGFDAPIADGAGADFAVFENGFLSGGAGMAFLELAFVEVSTDGVNFFRFDATSETQTATQVGGFGLLDASNLNNLAGKHIAGYGTGFDLAELAGVSPLLDIFNVNFVRIVDVVGSINPLYGSRDKNGNMVNDPYSTPFASSGFDLAGVGVINFATTQAVPEPSSLAMGGIGLALAAAVARAKRRRAS